MRTELYWKTPKGGDDYGDVGVDVKKLKRFLNKYYMFIFIKL
jgi:hypothetical protein